MSDLKEASQSEKLVNFVVIDNPFEPHKRQHHTRPWRAVSTLRDYLDGVVGSWAVSINGQMVDFDKLEEYTVAPDDFVVLAPIPEGGGDSEQGEGGGGSKNILRLVAVVALTYFTMGMGGMAGGSFLTLTGAGGYLAAGAVYIGGTLMINNLLAPPDLEAQESQESGANSYGLDGAKNTSLDGIPIPLCYGRFRMAGNIIALHTSTQDESNQTVHLLINAGEGEIAGISDVEVNDLPSNNYDALEDTATSGSIVEHIRLGTANDAPIPNFGKVLNTVNRGAPLHRDEQGEPVEHRFITENGVDRIRLDLLAPDGIYYQKKGQSDINWATVFTRVYFREVDPITNQPLDPGETGWRQFTSGSFVDTSRVSYANDEHLASDSSNYWMGDDENGVLWDMGGNRGRVDWSNVTQYLLGEKIPRDITQRTRQPYGELRAYVDGGTERQVVGWFGPTSYKTRPLNSHLSENSEIYDAIGIRITRKTRDSVRYSAYSPNLGGGKFEVIVFGEGITPSEQNEDPDAEGIAYNMATLTDSVEITDAAINYNHTAKLGLDIHMGEHLRSLPKVTFINEGIKIRVWNEETRDFEIKASSNPAWIAWDMMTHERYGAGVPMERMVRAHFIEWARFCDENELEFNGVIEAKLNVWDAVRPVFRAGRASPLNVGTRYGVSILKPKTPTMMFTNANIIKDSFSSSWLPMSERANQVDVTFFDKTNSYKSRTIRLVDDEALARGAPPRPTEMTLLGVTSAAQAAKEGRLAIETNKLSQTASFECSIDSLACSVGDVIKVQHDMPKWGFAGKIAPGSVGRVLQLDRPVTMHETNQNTISFLVDSAIVGGATVVSARNGLVTVQNFVKPAIDNSIKVYNDSGQHVKSARFFDSDSEFVIEDPSEWALVTGGQSLEFIAVDLIVEENVVYAPGEVTEVTLESDPEVTPPVYANWAFGHTQSQSKPFTITGIHGSGLEKRTINALEYDTAVYTDGELIEIPDYIDHDTTPLPVTGLSIREEIASSGNVRNIFVNATWVQPKDFRHAKVHVSVNGQPFEYMGEHYSSYRRQVYTNDTVRVRVVTVNIYGKETPLALSPTVSHVVGSETIVNPIVPLNFSASQGNTFNALTWDLESSTDGQTLPRLYEIWFAERQKDQGGQDLAAPVFENPYDEGSSGGDYAKLVVTASSYYTHVGLTPDTEYYYVLFAKDSQYQDRISNASPILVSRTTNQSTEVDLTDAVGFEHLQGELSERINLIDTTEILGSDGLLGLINAHNLLITSQGEAVVQHQSAIESNGSAITGLQQVDQEQATMFTALGSYDATNNRWSNIYNLQQTTATQASAISSLETVTSDTTSQVNSLATTTGEHAATLNSLSVTTGQNSNSINDLSVASNSAVLRLASLESTSDSHSSSINTLEQADESLAQSIHQVSYYSYNIDQSVNMLDIADWVVGTNGTQTGKTVWSHNGGTTESAIINGPGPYGPTLLWKSVSTGGNDASGGWNTDFDVDETKRYRFVCWYRREDLVGSAYLGCHRDNTSNLNGAVNTNPYFYSISGSALSSLGVEVGDWFMIVGHLYESSYNGAGNSEAGLYNASGERIASGLNFKMSPGTTRQRHRAYYYYASEVGATQYFAEPRVEVVDGTEVPLSDLIDAHLKGQLKAVEISATANAERAQLALKVEADGRVAGIGLEATDTDTSILFSADKIGFQNGSGSDVLPFYMQDGVVHIKDAVMNTVLAQTIVNVDDPDDETAPGAELGNTAILGKLSLLKAGQIKWRDLDPSFRDTLVQIDPEASVTGGSRSLSRNNFTVESLYLAMAGGTEANGNQPLLSGGAPVHIEIEINGGIPKGSFYQGTNVAPSITFQVRRRKLPSGGSELLDTQSYTGTRGYSAISGEPVESWTNISESYSLNPPESDAGEYEYFIVVTSKTGSWSTSGTQGGSIAASVRETLGSSGGILVQSLAWSGESRMSAGSNGVSVRNGALYVDNFGRLIANSSGTLYSEGQEVYSPSNNPSASDVGAFGVADGTYPGISVNGSVGSWFRTTQQGLLPYAPGGNSSSLGSSSWPFQAIHGQQIFEDGILLSSKYLRANASSTTTGSLTVEGVMIGDQLRNRTGSQLVLNAGESHTAATGQSAERVYLNAEGGVEISASPDNWGSGWAGRVTTTISSSGITWDGNAIWHAGNDGPGSGLNADLLDSLQATSFLRSNAAAQMRSTLECDYGIHGGYGNNNGSGSDWGAGIWSMGTAYDGGHAGNSYSVPNYGLSWLRSGHDSYTSYAGEGLYLFSQNSRRGGWGHLGFWTSGTVRSSGLNYAADHEATSDISVKENLVEIDNPLERVRHVTGFLFDRIDTERRTGGIIAQDFEKALPEGVSEVDGKLRVSTQAEIGLLYACVNALVDEVEKLKHG